MNKAVTLSKEEITTLNKIKDYLTEEEIDTLFPKFRDILIKVKYPSRKIPFPFLDFKNYLIPVTKTKPNPSPQRFYRKG